MEELKSDTQYTLISQDPITFKKYKCIKCHAVNNGIGILFHKSEKNGVDRDYKFCWSCWLQWHKDNLGEVEEFVETK